MRSATLNINRNQLGLAAMLAALLVLLLLNFSSTGVVRHGGEEDEGSGIGGTGRMLTPGSGFGGTGRAPTGGSGLGGTGFRPFLSVNDAQEVEINHSVADAGTALTASLDLQIDATIPVSVDPVESPIEVTAEQFITRDSGPINITESIQVAVNSNALAFEQLHEQLQAEVEAVATSESEADLVSDSVTDLVQAEEPALTWSAVASYLAANMPERDESTELALNLTDVDYEEADSERADRPEKIQRPVLPPIQRARPIQRAAILPPRVQPFRL